MPDWVCPRCNYSTNHKQNIERHFYTRKKVCVRKGDGVENLTDEIKTHVLKYFTYEAPNDFDLDDLHIKALVRRIKELENENKVLRESCPIIINNTNYNSINNINVTIKDFGNETLSHVISDVELITDCIHRMHLDGVPRLVKKIYFDPEHPENSTIKLNIEHTDKLMIHKNGEWEMCNNDECIEKLMNASMMIMIKNPPESIDDKIAMNQYTHELLKNGSKLHKKVTQKTNVVVRDNATFLVAPEVTQVLE